MKPNTPPTRRFIRLLLASLSVLLMVSTLATPASAHDGGSSTTSEQDGNENSTTAKHKLRKKVKKHKKHDPTGSATVITEDELAFMAISPFATFGSAQGDFSSGAHGTFGIFGAGAASPPHTHTGTYYGVVLSGEMNNPFGTEAAPPSLGPGSFWSVPADEQHVTACLTTDTECKFFFHSASAFDFFPIDDLTEAPGDAAQSIPVEDLAFYSPSPFFGVATVWGNPTSDRYGVIVRLAAGAKTGDVVVKNSLTIVPMAGSVELDTGDGDVDVAIGSIIEVEADTGLELKCEGDETCLFYIFSEAGPLAMK